MAYGVYSDRGYREHILERNKNTNKTEVFTQEDQTFTGRKTFLSGVTTSDLEVQTVEVSESLKVKGKDIKEIIDYLPNDVSKENKLTTEDFVNSSISTNTANFLGTLNTVKASVKDIQALIPNQATKDNQLADKDFVNSSISTNTANFLGTFNTLEEIEALTDVTNNDYAFWKTTDTLGSVVFKRYKYIADEQLWKFEYDLNNSSFTAAQWDAINSGITAELVSQIGQGGGSALVPSITQEQYNNLTEAEKNNGQIREITNTNPKKVMLNGMNLFLMLDDSIITSRTVLSAAKIRAEIDARHKYSAEEIDTGEKWIDGKPIYRKVFYSPINWSNGTIVGNIGNIDVVININSTSCTNNGNWFTGYNVPTLENTAFVKPDGSVVVARAGTFVNNIKALVIVEYTKTTD